jgi:hypothetical protein
MRIDKELTILEGPEDWNLPAMEGTVGSAYWETIDPGWIIIRGYNAQSKGTEFVLIKTHGNWLRDLMRIGIHRSEERYPFAPDRRSEFANVVDVETWS